MLCKLEYNALGWDLGCVEQIIECQFLSPLAELESRSCYFSLGVLLMDKERCNALECFLLRIFLFLQRLIIESSFKGIIYSGLSCRQNLKNVLKLWLSNEWDRVGKREKSMLWGRMGGRAEFFLMLLHYEIFVSLQKRFPWILCSVGDLKALKVFVV